MWFNNSDNFIVTDPTISQLNTFTGSVTQQATSVVTATDPACYEQDGGCFSIYGFEVNARFYVDDSLITSGDSQYKPGFDDAVRIQLLGSRACLTRSCM